MSLEPKFTSVAPVKLVPVRVTVLPPSVEPDDRGERRQRRRRHVRVRLASEVPPGFTTLTLTPPAALRRKSFTVIDVSLLIVKQSLTARLTSFPKVHVGRGGEVRPREVHVVATRGRSAWQGAGSSTSAARTYVYVLLPEVPLGVLDSDVDRTCGCSPGTLSTVIDVSLLTVKHVPVPQACDVVDSPVHVGRAREVWCP